mmetsp:Transcript_27453/g.58737  ORF Transcript_27453/g.58737 Transcript_27453/m.58737 type:complete len:236 (-) Transcript_27453:150-857(-)
MGYHRHIVFRPGWLYWFVFRSRHAGLHCLQFRHGAVLDFFLLDGFRFRFDLSLSFFDLQLLLGSLLVEKPSPLVFQGLEYFLFSLLLILHLAFLTIFHFFLPGFFFLFFDHFLHELLAVHSLLYDVHHAQNVTNLRRQPFSGFAGASGFPFGMLGQARKTHVCKPQTKNIGFVQSPSVDRILEMIQQPIREVGVFGERTRSQNPKLVGGIRFLQGFASLCTRRIFPDGHRFLLLC